MNHSILLALLICNSFLQQWETWPSLSSVNLFNFSIPIHIYRGYCDMKIFPVISINKKCHSLRWFLASNVNKSSPNCHPIPEAATPQGDCWAAGGIQGATICHSLRWTKKQDLAPDTWSAYERNVFSEPRGLHLIHKMLNSLTWYLIFMLRLPAPFVTNLCIAWLPLLPP